MFDARATEPELLDSPYFDPQRAQREYRVMQVVNVLFGGTRVVKRYLRRQWDCVPPDRPLRVLDMGSGACDIPIAVARWARRQGREIEFTCVECNPAAIVVAHERLERAGETSIRLIQGDVFAHRPDEPYDFALGSLFFHHLDDGQILALLEHLRGIVRCGVLVNDLLRSVWHYAGAWVVTLPASHEARHDGLLSIRRSFRARELRQFLRRLPDVRVRAGTAWAFRVWAEVQFTGARSDDSAPE